MACSKTDPTDTDSSLISPDRLSDIPAFMETRFAKDDSVSLRMIIDAFGTRAYGPLLFLFAVPNAIPSIPGVLAVLGLPLIFLAVQMALGRVPWVPTGIGQTRLKKETLMMLCAKILPWLVRIDKITKPRWQWLSHPRMERLIGICVLLLSLSVFTPLPFTNMIPAIALCVVAIGLLKKDGIAIAIGLAVGAVGLTITTLILWALIKGLFFLL